MIYIFKNQKKKTIKKVTRNMRRVTQYRYTLTVTHMVRRFRLHIHKG